MRKFIKIFGGVVAAYIFVYVLLSINGSYQPMATDLTHVIDYEWAPLGFYNPDFTKKDSMSKYFETKNSGGWNRLMQCTFIPLWELDILYVHRYSFDGKNPAELHK